MSTLAEKLAYAWIKRDLIQLKSDELPKNREDSHAIQTVSYTHLTLPTICSV